MVSSKSELEGTKLASFGEASRAALPAESTGMHQAENQAISHILHHVRARREPLCRVSRPFSNRPPLPRHLPFKGDFMVAEPLVQLVGNPLDRLAAKREPEIRDANCRLGNPK